jgi:hypothetical protein
MAVPQPEFTGFAWYEAYDACNASDGADGRLVAPHTFSAPWTSRELHPAGDEVVVCTGGEITRIQELADTSTTSVTVSAGDDAINPPDVWRTANVADQANALFVTAGKGTGNRPC